MLLSLLAENDPFLKTPVGEFTDWERAGNLARDLGETMCHHNALGLAANQVGLSDRVFVMRSPQGWRACFNPIVEPVGPTELHEEACLSFPRLSLRLKRSSTVFLRWTDENQNECQDMMTGYDAYCAAHELDHLNGITFDTRVSKLVLDMAKKKRVKMTP